MKFRKWTIAATSLPAALSIVLVLATVTNQPAQAQTFNVIHAFSGGMDGAYPTFAGPLDQAGNLYGTSLFGGGGYGTVFKLKHTNSGWVFDPLYLFTGEADGANPVEVTFGPDGSLYGPTIAGGIGGCSFQGRTGCGTVFRLRPQPRACTTALCPWTETVLYSFTGGSDGWQPEGELLFDQAGNIYGTTQDGGQYGTCNGYVGCGTVFKLTLSGGGWNKAALWNFGQGGDGAIPLGGVIPDAAGSLYGATLGGGSYGLGTVYQLMPSGSGWTENVLYSFTGLSDGSYAGYGVILDQTGNLYGTSQSGGAGGGGTVFELTPANGGWSYALVYSFAGSTGPLGKLAMDQAGDLYGATYADGAYGYGSIFKLTRSGGGWTYTSLHDFTGGSDGAYPYSFLALDAHGNLYGTASSGGTSGQGVVWEITP